MIRNNDLGNCLNIIQMICANWHGHLLDYFCQTEVGRTDHASYEVIYGQNQHKLKKQITAMTIGELVDEQASYTKRFKSSGSGGYQVMRKTLQDLSRELCLFV